jgi:hypothetical protein
MLRDRRVRIDTPSIDRSLRIVFFFLALVFAACSAFAQENEVERFRNALIDYFLPLNYVPVLVSQGNVVGDVIEVDGGIKARSARCFPSLKPPAPAESSLEEAVQSASAGVSFGLGLRQIFNSAAGTNLDRRFRIRFSDVTVVAVSRAELKDALDRNACPEITPLVDGTVTPLDRSRNLYFVVSAIMYGKRNAVLEFVDKANVEAKVDRLARQVGDATLNFQASNGGLVIVKSGIVLPIALKPVTIPKLVTVRDVYQFRNNPQYQLDWQPLECSAGQSCRQLFQPFADLVKASKPRLSGRDVDQ